MSRSSKGSNIAKDVDQDQPSRNEGEGYKEGDSEQEKMSYQDQKQQQFSTGNNPQIKNMGMSLLQGGHGDESFAGKQVFDQEQHRPKDNHQASALVSPKGYPSDQEANTPPIKPVDEGSSNRSGVQITPREEPETAHRERHAQTQNSSENKERPAAAPIVLHPRPEPSSGGCSCCSIL